MLKNVEESQASGLQEVGSSVERGVAIVTGGRRGIGRAICDALARSGFDIAVVDLVDDERTHATVDFCRRVGRSASFMQADIARIDGHSDLVRTIDKTLGPITCLVNNAGVQVSERGDLLEFDEDTFDRVLNVNLKGAFFLTQAVAKRMIASPAPARERSIINITSANAQLVSPEKGPYGVSKAGLSMASQQFAVRLADEGIRVHEVRPGLIETDMTADVRGQYTPSMLDGRICPLRRWGQPEDVATAVCALATGLIPYATGDIYSVGGGMQIPRL